ncbi:MAG: hypothetical protein ACJA1A_001258 [Saprospiraceae bacterium]|jgi:hypothetical protein
MVDVSAQFGDSRDFARMSQQKTDSIAKSNLPDTIILRYFKLSDITTFYDFQDSTLDNFFHQYDPAKRRWVDYQNLGNAGSAARSQIYESKPYIGFDEGLNQYDLYNFELDDFRFFENNTPLTNVFFSPVGGQQNFVIRSDFARNFNDGTAISLNYRRIRQQGFYSNQLTKTTNFGVSLRFQSENKRYTGFLSMLSNVNEEGQNGGIALDTFFLNPQLGDRANVPVVSKDAQTRHQQKQYSLINYYQLNKPEKNQVQYLLRYDLKFDSRYYKFSDATTSASADSIEYGQFNIEDRGIRFYNKVNKISNAFYAYASDGEKLNIRAGLVYDRYDIDQLGFESGFDNLYVDFKGDVPITKSIAIKSTGQLGLADGAGDFHLRGSLNLDLGSWIDINGGAAFYRFTPDLISRSLVLNGLKVKGWEKDLTKPVGSDLFGEFDIPKLKIKGNIKQSLVNNAIYYDTTSTVRQTEEIFSSTSISIANEFTFWKLGMENYAMFQIFSDNIYNLPTLYSKHNLHITGYLFDRALYARFGAEVRLNPTHTGSDYSQVIGQFRQSTETLEFYPMTDVYFTGKVKTFRLFLRFENINNLFQDNVSYQVAKYPQFDFKLRFGVSWLLLN